jgi:hypothetical protein
MASTSDPSIRPAEAAEQTKRNHAMTAALIGGAAAAAAGAVWGARRLARRDGVGDGPLNPVMKNALTASQLGCGGRNKVEPTPKEPSIPSAPTEPRVRAAPAL